MTSWPRPTHSSPPIPPQPRPCCYTPSGLGLVHGTSTERSLFHFRSAHLHSPPPPPPNTHTTPPSRTDPPAPRAARRTPPPPQADSYQEEGSSTDQLRFIVDGLNEVLNLSPKMSLVTFDQKKGKDLLQVQSTAL